MSTAGRKAAKAGKVSAEGSLKSLGVPQGFDRNVGGRQVDAVKQGIVDKSARLRYALGRYEDVLQAQLSKGTAQDKAARIASKELDDVADLVKQHAIEAKGGDPTVLADIAGALASLDPSARQMILRRAGNPEIFQPLEAADLPDMPEQTAITDFDQAWGGARIAAEDKEAARATSREALPLIARPSAHMQQHGRVTKTGATRKASQIYKDHLPRNDSPMDVDTSERRHILETAGPEALQQVPLTAQEKRALKTLAGDQIKQANAILRKQREAAGYSEKLFDSLSPEEQAAVDARIGAGAYLPDAVKERGAAAEERRLLSGLRRQGDTMTIGTSLDPQGKWSGKNPRTVDRVVDSRSRGSVDRVLSMMYELAEQPDASIDLDKYMPWWRSRFGVPDSTGALQYPSSAPSPQFITMLAQGMFNAHDPNFYSKMLPLIERSIQRAPASPQLTLGEGGATVGGRPAGGQRSASYYDTEQFTPSPQMKKAMEGGVGGADYPVEIYGDRTLERAPLEAPALTPTPEGKPQTLDPQKTNDVLDAIEQMRQRLRQQPGNTDTSSIYMVPQNSPVRFLMA